MRNPIVFSLFVLSMLFITSCGVDEELKPLTGEWRLNTTSGGFGGAGYPVSGEIKMTIDGDDLILNVDDSTSFIAKLCYEKGDYSDIVVIDKSFVQESEDQSFILPEKMHYYLNEEFLTLSPLCIDCLSYHFVRI